MDTLYAADAALFLEDGPINSGIYIVT